MAADAQDGVLYRPVVSTLGYGGTRYAPLFPIIIAGFMRLGIDPAITAISTLLMAFTALVLGAATMMRNRSAR